MTNHAGIMKIIRHGMCYGKLPSGGIEIIKKFIEDGGDVDLADRYGCSLLQMAARIGNITIVNMLVTRGANVNHADRSSRTPIIETYNVEIIRLLLQYGADPNIANISGVTLMSASAEINKPAVITLLATAGADTDGKGPYGQPLRNATKRSHPDCITALLDGGADRMVRNKKRKTAADAAEQTGKKRIAHMLARPVKIV